ncbi:hypothetical protein THRCLA_22422 [Thraustotheca clavata]|uniref:Uncharacterized protein n=1 Tax=Thraustotheca clavata TaxID=74557 RepID=A0A1V9Z239_9STRA|nr:hypothetical protein THRCLA_22422 [Thraustotheca clavata]
MMAKRLQFTTVTIYEFPLTYGGSAVPEDTGPPIGLASTHVHHSVARLDEDKKPRRGRVARWPHADRVEVLKKACFTQKEIAAICFEAIDIRRSRLETVEEIQQLRELERKKKRKELRRAKRAREECKESEDCQDAQEPSTKRVALEA